MGSVFQDGRTSLDKSPLGIKTILSSLRQPEVAGCAITNSLLPRAPDSELDSEAMQGNGVPCPHFCTAPRLEEGMCSLHVLDLDSYTSLPGLI